MWKFWQAIFLSPSRAAVKKKEKEENHGNRKAFCVTHIRKSYNGNCKSLSAWHVKSLELTKYIMIIYQYQQNCRFSWKNFDVRTNEPTRHMFCIFSAFSLDTGLCRVQ